MSDRTELLKLHDWDELLFGGYYCLHCTPDDEDSFDDPIAWPCLPLREAGVTDDDARALIEAHREKVAAEYEAEKAAKQAELQRRVDGHSACIALSHVDVVTEDEWEAAKAVEATAAERAPKDTLAPWLAQRFDPQGAPWAGMSDDDRSYWERQARAVRRAVARGGFKAEAGDPR